MSLDVDNPLNEFLLEAHAFAPARRLATATAAVALDVKPPVSARGSASIHDLSATETRVVTHATREAADTRRRITELKHTLEVAIANQTADLQRLTWILRLTIYVLLAVGMAQFGLIVWTRAR